MSGFVCQASVVPDGQPSPEVTIANDGFFPDVDPAQLRLLARVDPAVTSDRLRDAVLGALIAEELDLHCWKAGQLAKGYKTLAAVPALEVGGESRLVILYRRALVALVRVQLLERMREVNTTAAGDRRADMLDPQIEDLKRDAAYAVRDLLGRPRIMAELI